MYLQEKVKDKIKIFIRETGMKPYQVADGAGVPHSCVYDFINDKKDLALKTASKLNYFIDTYRKKNDLI